MNYLESQTLYKSHLKMEHGLHLLLGREISFVCVFFFFLMFAGFAIYRSEGTCFARFLS